MRKVIAALKAAGATDVKTQSVSLSPRYNEQSEPQGFVAVNSVSATIKQLARAGARHRRRRRGRREPGLRPVALGAATRPSSTARRSRLAVANARANAQVLAAAANLSLGRVTAIVEGGGAPQPLPYAANKAMALDSATPIEPGTQQTAATVTRHVLRVVVRTSPNRRRGAPGT